MQDAISLITRIQAALGTAEFGDALVEVARNAHSAEVELAALKSKAQELGYELTIDLLEENFDD